MNIKSSIVVRNVILLFLIGYIPQAHCRLSFEQPTTCTLLKTADYQTPFCQNQYQQVLKFTPNVFNPQNHQVLPGQSLGGIVGIYRRVANKEQICYISCGLRRINGKPPNENTMFELASITKTFTASVLGTMIYNKLINPTERVQKFLPEGFLLNPNEAAVTFQQLATFSGGICFSNAPNVNLRSPNQKLNQLNFQSDINQLNPNLKYCINNQKSGINVKSVYADASLPTYNHYSNSSFGLLAQALMHYDNYPNTLEGSFNGWICSNLTNILAMNSTNSCLPSQAKKGTCPVNTVPSRIPCNTSQWQNAQYAMGYHINQNHYQLGKPFPFVPWAGAGVLRSNASDMIKYIRANLGISTNQSSKQLALIKGMQLAHNANQYRPVLAEQFAKTNIGNQSPLHGTQGYAWVCQFINGDRICGKIGGHTNFRSFVGFSQNKQYGLVILLNTGMINQRYKPSVPSVSEIGVNLIKNY